MIDARLLRMLDMSSAPGDPSATHLSAASGLVRVGQRLFVVADDELSLGVFDLTSRSPGQPVRLFEGELPTGHRERKAEKPDLEALTALPPFGNHAFGALMAVGSGSRPNRQRAVLLPLDPNGAVDGNPAHVDLAALYAPLRARLCDLNIEGLFISDGNFCLLQRGGRGAQVNAFVQFEWNEVARWIQGAKKVPDIRSIDLFDLGKIDGVPLAFTDGAALQSGGWVFCAVSEDTPDSYTDGRCVGSAVGLVNAAGKLKHLEQITGAFKAEGIAVASEGTPLELLLVTDADDRLAAASLLSVTLPLGT